jgi:hypothetical protein
VSRRRPEALDRTAPILGGSDVVVNTSGSTVTTRHQLQQFLGDAST